VTDSGTVDSFVRRAEHYFDKMVSLHIFVALREYMLFCVLPQIMHF
jgi:hypothetical protein